MSVFDHIFLFGFLFTLFYYITRLPQNMVNKFFWQIMIFVIIAYSIITGCRYGWGNDYLWYKLRYEYPEFYEDEDIGFKFLNYTIGHIGLNYVGAYITYSFLYITTAFILIKDYKENKYMLAFFLPATLLQITFTIRQSVAHSFIFLALHYLNKRKWNRIILMLLIAYTIHPASILLFLPFFLFQFTNRIISPILSIIIYTIVTLSGTYISSLVSLVFSKYLPRLTLGNKFNQYLQNGNWYNENAILEEYSQSTLTMLLSMLFHISLIYLSYIALKYKPNKQVALFYNTTVIGLIFLRLFWNFEIFRRIVNPYTIIYFIPLGYAFYIYKEFKYSMDKTTFRFCRIAIYSTMIYIILYWGRFILLSPKYIFYWNT